MQIIEQLGCMSDAGVDPARRCRIKCRAAALGAVLLIAVVSIGYVLNAGAVTGYTILEAEASAHE